MRFFVLCAALAVTACGGGTDAAVDEPVEAAAAEPTAMTTYDGGPVTGTYEATSTDGTVLTQTIDTEGSITTIAADGSETRSTFTLEDDEFCIADPEGDASDCYTYSNLAEDGSWTATNAADAQDVWTIRRIES